MGAHLATITRGTFAAGAVLLLAACAATNDREYRSCLTTFTAVGIGAGSAGGAGGAALGGAAAGSAAAMGLCSEADEAASLEPPALPPAGSTAVNAIADSDRDGVDEGDDRCQDTPAGIAVDADGCSRPLVFDGRVLNFAFNSAELPPDAAQTLQPAAAFIGEHPKVRFMIVGHTDAVGTDSYNNGLSLERARAVRDALVAQGVSVAQMRIRGEGEQMPIANNATEAGRAKNRRVEISLIR